MMNRDSKTDLDQTMLNKDLSQLATLRDEELFDIDYYRSRFMDDECVSEDDVYRHFLSYCHLDQRTPTPKFDPYEYIERYADVRSNGMNAFLHYATWGRSEGRTYAPQRIENRSVLPRRLQGDTRRYSVAIVIHLYYLDYIQLLCQRLSELDFEFDLFVSCPHADAVDHVISAFSKVCSGQVVVEAFPNRGRNIAPLFVGFAGYLSKYDVVGHVHTKKSLYTGSVKMDWSMHLLAPVLGAPGVVARALSQFQDPAVAIVTSERYSLLPFWSQHVLKNENMLRALCEEFNLPPANGFIDYPVGGMFWLRGDIYQEISGLKKTFDDFPDELGQTDGTLHHAIERLVGYLATSRELSIVKYDPRSGEFYIGENPWKEVYSSNTYAGQLYSAKTTSVVSFDLFDTLIMRDASDPDASKRVLARQHDVGSMFPSLSYVEARNRAEFIARQKQNFEGDVGWLEIASELASIGSITLQVGLSLLAREAEIDIELIRPRNRMIELYSNAKSSGVQVIIVTDSYYPRGIIERILEKCRISRPNALYVSSELGLRKDRGDIWPYIRDREGNNVIHFGDNMVSDVQNANDAGINGQYVLSPLEKVMWLGFIKRQPNDLTWPLYRECVVSYGDDPFFG